ncbi:hypothetical protein HYPSUDRAFT_210001 [Hypholoma sublateritium FD-334 SS-4]|uniref:Uncharacterized protein n=1 Tax=Hypholoma sublateritium (strain FD-334 SS-4) TaxID=945553 RepID=A0A0D2NWI7_HYPSF|nr:hypothetical protein HYPSUDRAFT_210001 [Hypholoma sublateritium FD-334 SS-4]
MCHAAVSQDSSLLLCHVLTPLPLLLAFPSVSSSLYTLSQATSIHTVTLHPGMHAPAPLAAESTAKLHKALSLSELDGLAPRVLRAVCAAAADVRIAHDPAHPPLLPLSAPPKTAAPPSHRVSPVHGHVCAPLSSPPGTAYRAKQLRSVLRPYVPPSAATFIAATISPGRSRLHAHSPLRSDALPNEENRTGLIAPPLPTHFPLRPQRPCLSTPPPSIPMSPLLLSMKTPALAVIVGTYGTPSAPPLIAAISDADLIPVASVPATPYEPTPAVGTSFRPPTKMPPALVVLVDASGTVSTLHRCRRRLQRRRHL